MAVERMDQLEAKIEALRSDIGALARELTGISVLIATTTDALKEERRKGQEDRAAIWIQVRGLGEKLIDLSNKVSAIADKIGDLLPAVRSLEIERAADRATVTSAITTGGIVARVVWTVGTAAVGAAVALGAYIGIFKPLG